MINWDNIFRQNTFNVSLVAGLTIIFGVLGLFILWLSSSGQIVLMCALALFGGGFFLGFLFGIPRVDQNVKKSTREAAAVDDEYVQQINTNLEQISDWLTKIIVGVGLVELGKLYAFFQGATAFIAGGIGIDKAQQAQALAAAIIVYFMILGFLSGYILTRIFLASAFRWADQLSSSKQYFNALNNVEVVSFGKLNIADRVPDIAKPVEKAATQLAKLPLQKLSGKPEDYAAWAKAQLIKKNYEDAIKGYALAVSQFPDDIGLLLEFAGALEEAGRPTDDVRTKLLTAYKKITPRTPQSQVQMVYNALAYVSLYLEAPKGFNDAIKYGEEYVARTSGAAAGSIWVNLAAAYGQKYTYYSRPSISPSEREKSGIVLEEVKGKAFEAIKNALDSDRNWLDTFRMLMLKDYKSTDGKPKDSAENDLECFASDNKFRELLEL